jgi:hypothetical protein
MKICAFLFLSFALTALGFAANKSRESQTEDIHEAVFRWQFDHNGSGLQKKAKVYFIELGEESTDPTGEFLKRFAGNRPPVRKGSECTGTGTGEAVRDKKTGEEGLLFHVSKVAWKPDTKVEVKGGYFERGLSSSENTYTVEKEKGKWRVKNDHIDIIS